MPRFKALIYLKKGQDKEKYLVSIRRFAEVTPYAHGFPCAHTIEILASDVEGVKAIISSCTGGAAGCTGGVLAGISGIERLE